MNKVVLLIIIVMASANGIYAQRRQQVTRNEAISVARTCLGEHNTQLGHDMQNAQIIEKNDSTGNTILYEVTLDDRSVLLSGSRACYPLLARYHGSILADYDNLPDNLRWVIDGYISQITPCFHNDTVRLYYNDDWYNLINDTNLSPRRNVEYGPLLTSKWNQQGCNIGNETGYEYYCPIDPNSGLHYSVGCGAVAMGQVMNYWKHPVSGSWKMKFDWCNMSDILDANSPTFIKNREAIAYLLRQCADSINTRYISQSMSYVDSIRIALVSDYFQYNPNAMYIQRMGYPEEIWIEILKNQIECKRPVIYSVNANGGGHTFVCDGYAYDDLGRFNISANFGLGNNFFGWFLLDEIHIGNTYFTNSQSAIINIYPYPDDHIILCDRDVYLDGYYTSYQNEIASGTHLPWEMLPVTVTNLTSASTDSPSSWRTIPTGEESTYQAQESVTLKDGFTVERGADFAAIITPCDNCGSREFVARMLDSPMNYASEHAEQQMQGYSEGTSSDAEGSMSFLSLRGNEDSIGIRIHPNPARGKVAVTLAAGAPQGTVLKVLDMAGHEVLSQPVASGAENVTLDLSALSAGSYFVTLATPQGSSTQKLILE
ncbi:MAG: C10 family peptidase [Bacteroidales bacterium]|nr:C10 family peptidase [Bacteroidales bacterium]